MKKIPSVILAGSMTLFSLFASAVETVNQVDLPRYMGRWYEISSIPAKFQRKCVRNTTAEYRLLETGKVDVLNSCMKADGKYQVANGLAQVKNRTTNAELGVSFVPFLNHFGWFEGQYKILMLDPDYQWVLVGEDKLEFGWILSRKPSLSVDTLAEIEKEIRRQGYDSCKFLTSMQDGGNYQERKPLCNVVKE